MSFIEFTSQEKKHLIRKDAITAIQEHRERGTVVIFEEGGGEQGILHADEDYTEVKTQMQPEPKKNVLNDLLSELLTIFSLGVVHYTKAKMEESGEDNEDSDEMKPENYEKKVADISKNVEYPKGDE